MTMKTKMGVPSRSMVGLLPGPYPDGAVPSTPNAVGKGLKSEVQGHHLWVVEPRGLDRDGGCGDAALGTA